ncbi:hypothetical protein R1sor_001868 [Riccia sorocarpa]|uniref:Uncharacterized protein n=1 Tax=Riccia sorocarpa TaxID=122646 RepID=A0ABD3H1C7_9MARC
MAGDMNMVELADDSKGKTALLFGSEARAWKYLAQELGLVDAYLCAVIRAGGNFTRYAFSGKMYDHAIIDRRAMDKLKTVWEAHPADAGNPQRKWQLAWIRVRDVLKAERRKVVQEQRLTVSRDTKLKGESLLGKGRDLLAVEWVEWASNRNSNLTE